MRMYQLFTERREDSNKLMKPTETLGISLQSIWKPEFYLMDGFGYIPLRNGLTTCNTKSVVPSLRGTICEALRHQISGVTPPLESPPPRTRRIEWLLLQTNKNWDDTLSSHSEALARQRFPHTNTFWTLLLRLTGPWWRSNCSERGRVQTNVLSSHVGIDFFGETWSMAMSDLKTHVQKTERIHWKTWLAG